MTSMSDASWHDEAAKQTRILQIIVAALVMGCLFFLLIVLSIGSVVKPVLTVQPISLTTIASVLAGIELIAWVVVTWAIVTKGRREILNGTYKPVNRQQQTGENDACREAEHLLSVFQNKTIISSALFEGIGFFATIAFLLERNPIALGLAAVMILGVAAQFPTRSRIIGWVERQMGAIEP